MRGEINRRVAEAIDENRAALAAAVTDGHYEAKPELSARYGARGREKCLEDAAYHLSYLSESIAADRPELFADYAAWAKTLLAGFGVGAADLTDNLELIQRVLRRHLAAEDAALACAHVEAGIRRVAESTGGTDSFLGPAGGPLAGLAERYLQALLRGERGAAARLIFDAVEGGGVPVKDIYLSVFQPSQREIGRLWQMNRLTVAQEHYCTAATQSIMSQLYRHIFTGEKKGRTMVATCVEGDYHEIGARMVADFFEMEGWDTHYLGANVPTPAVVKILAERRADLVVVSATMTFHVRAVRRLIGAIRASEETRGVKIMVGGYPFNIAPGLWEQIGADACSRDAAEAVAAANKLIEGRSG